MGNIIELRRISKAFGALKAVDDISLEVREGEFITLLGPSGCGKTTTLRMVGGFEFPDSGAVYLDGRDVTDLPPYERQVNMVFQDYALFPHMTIAENVGYGLRVAGVPRAEVASRVEEALEMVSLPDKAEARPAMLSKGQQQRIALARALVRKPRVLLLDEPLSALDLKLREAMQVEMKHLHEKVGITFVMVTHDQLEALVMSDRIVVMQNGRIVQDGSPTELYEHPASPYVANFIGSSNLLDARVTGVDDGLLSAEFAGGTLRARSPATRPAVGDAVTLCVRPEKVRVLVEGQSPAAGCERIDGRVVEQLFHGNTVRLAVDLGTDTPFIADQPLETALASSRVPRPGDRISLAVHPDNVTVFGGR